MGPRCTWLFLFYLICVVDNIKGLKQNETSYRRTYNSIYTMYHNDLDTLFPFYLDIILLHYLYYSSYYYILLCCLLLHVLCTRCAPRAVCAQQHSSTRRLPRKFEFVAA